MNYKVGQKFLTVGFSCGALEPCFDCVNQIVTLIRILPYPVGDRRYHVKFSHINDECSFAKSELHPLNGSGEELE